MSAVYAANPEDSRGRLIGEPSSHLRTAFQRDRDRIIHASAFRRLKHKTQVFVEHEGDLFRTRLTHSLEVAQVARTLAQALGFNEALTEAVALAHDLGHPPFGHTGEDALERHLEPYGGFDHNAQAIKIVTQLEKHYARWDGLNLSWETLEGIAKHNGPVPAPYPYALADYNAVQDLELSTFASAEAQVAAVADDIAYNSHDLQDGLRAGLFTLEDVAELPIAGACLAEVDAEYPGLEDRRRAFEVVRRFMGVLVEDVYETSRARIFALAPESVADIRSAKRHMVRFSPELFAELKAVRKFLFAKMYRAPPVMEMRASVTGVIDTLFPAYMHDPELLPLEWHAHAAEIAKADHTALARLVGDYISGMTDRFALQEYERLTGQMPQLIFS